MHKVNSFKNLNKNPLRSKPDKKSKMEKRKRKMILKKVSIPIPNPTTNRIRAKVVVGPGKN